MRLPRAALAAALTLLVLAALLAAPAAAQASPTVEVTAPAGPGAVSVDRQTPFDFNVCNTSEATPLDDQNTGNVFVKATSPWGDQPATPNAFDLTPGACQQVRVQVTVPAGSGGGGDLVVTATMYSPLRGLEDILGDVATQEATGEATLALEVQNSVTRDVMEALGPWIYALLLLLVAAVAVAIAIAVASRRTLVRLTAGARELSVPPGGKVAFAFQVEGLAKETDTALLQVSAVPEGWAAFLPVPELVLEPGQPQEVSLVVIAPRGAAQGARQAILVTATSAKAPRGAANLEFVASVEGIEDLPTAPRRAK